MIKYPKISEGLTVEDICIALGMTVPPALEDIRKNRIAFGAAGVKYFKKGAALFVIQAAGEDQLVQKAYELGAAVYVTRKQHYDKDGKPLPCLIVPDPNVAHVEFTAYVRKRFRGKIIAVTGSLGKTTTKDMIHLVLSSKYKTGLSKRNTNGRQAISYNIQNIQANLEYYVQELGAATPDLIRKGAYITRPHASIITNVSYLHTDEYDGIEGILDDKLNVIRYLQEDGVGFLNLDDERLAQVRDPHRIVTFATDNPEADYRAINIRVKENTVEYDVLNEGETTRILLNTRGEHNVMNSLAAFAVARWAGMSKQEIAAALRNYQGYEIRQNFVHVGGYNLYLDCYNNAPKSLAGAFEIIGKVPIEAGNRRIAVIGDLRHLSEEYARQAYQEVSDAIIGSNTDVVLCFGKNNETIYNNLVAAGKEAYFTLKRDELNEMVRQAMKPGDLIMFKGPVDLFIAKTVDQLFGTGYHFIEGGERKRVETLEYQILTINEMPLLAEGKKSYSAAIAKYKGSGGKVVIPEEHDGIPILAICSKVFYNNAAVTELVLPDTIYNIGYAAFYNCKRMRSVQMPASLRVIDRSAFNHCSRLRKVVVPEGTTDIGILSFYKCRRLEYIKLPASVVHIADDAFLGCPLLEVDCEKGSYAYDYAKDHNLKLYSATPWAKGKRKFRRLKRKWLKKLGLR